MSVDLLFPHKHNSMFIRSGNLLDAIQYLLMSIIRDFNFIKLIVINIKS